jgi:hypothetical protein
MAQVVEGEIALRGAGRACNAWQGGKVGNRRERASRRLVSGDLAPFSGEGPPFSVLTPEERFKLGYCSRVW